MPVFHIIILALVQGLTEFLPVSSSGHLILAHQLLGSSEAQRWDTDLLLDVAVHIGTLFSVLLYFRKDIFDMLRIVFNCECGAKTNSDKEKTDNSKRTRHLFLCVLIGSVPVIFAGLALHFWEPAWLRSPIVVAYTTILFGILLWWVDARAPTDKTAEDISLKQALMIGLSQILALIPGTSRSGITMTAGRYYQLDRAQSARFSLLLGIVAISGAGALGSLELLDKGLLSTIGTDVLLAVALSFVSGYAAIAVMMKFLERSTFKTFAIYRIFLGAILLAVIYADMFS